MTSYNLQEKIGGLTKVISHGDTTFGAKERIHRSYLDFQSDGSQKIQYRLNDYGFRSEINYSDLLHNKLGDYIVCLGCSHTEGIGVDVNDRWSEVLGRKLKLSVMNVGLTSGTETWCQYMYHNIEFMHGDKKPIAYFSLQPPARRLTIMDGRRVNFFQDFNFKTNAEDGSISYFSISNQTKTPVIDTYEEREDLWSPLDFTYYSQSQTYKSMCRDSNIINFGWEVLGEEYPKGTDNMHFGKDWHIDIANLFYKEYQNSKDRREII